jgi:hypothetical protein
VAETIDDTRDLERGYRRLVAFYPRSFRRENGDEIIAVLLATATSGQHRPGSDLAEGVARYAPAAVAASGVTWAIGLACVILICWKQSWPYYERQSA